MIRRPPRSTLFPYTDALPILAQRYVLAASGLKRSKLTELARLLDEQLQSARGNLQRAEAALEQFRTRTIDRKSTRLNSSHSQISYAVFCLKKKKHRARLTREQ